MRQSTSLEESVGHVPKLMIVLLHLGGLLPRLPDRAQSLAVPRLTWPTMVQHPLLLSSCNPLKPLSHYDMDIVVPPRTSTGLKGTVFERLSLRDCR